MHYCIRLQLIFSRFTQAWLLSSTIATLARLAHDMGWKISLIHSGSQAAALTAQSIGHLNPEPTRGFLGLLMGSLPRYSGPHGPPYRHLSTVQSQRLSDTMHSVIWAILGGGRAFIIRS